MNEVPNGVPDEPWWRRPSIQLAAVVLVVAVPFIVAAAMWLGRGYTATSDVSMIELRVRDLTGNLPLTGVYSRFGYQHPGPLLFYMLWIPYHLLGATGGALVASMILWSGLMVGVTVYLYGRHLGVRAAASAGATALIAVVIIGWKPIAEPWNPHITSLGSLCLVGLVHLAWSRSAAAAALVPILGTVLLQAHLGTGVFVVMMILAWAIAAAIELRRQPGPRPELRPQLQARLAASSDAGSDASADGERRRGLLRARLIGAAGSAVLWIPPVIDQFFGEHNFGRILHSMRTDDPTQQAVGWASAIRMSTMSWALPPWWATDGRHGPLELLAPSFRIPWLLIAAVIAVVGVGVMAKRRDVTVRREAIGVATVIAMVAIAIPPTFAGIRGVPWSYLVDWLPGAVIAAVALAVGLALEVGSAEAPSRIARATTGATLVVLLVFVVTATVRAPSTRLELPGAKLSRQLWSQLDGQAARATTPILIRSDLSFPSMELVPAIELLADRNDRQLLVEPRLSASMIPRRVAPSAPTEWLILTDAAADAEMTAHPDHIIAAHQPFTATQLAQLRMLWPEAATALQRGDGPSLRRADAEIQKIAGTDHLAIVSRIKPTA